MTRSSGVESPVTKRLETLNRTNRREQAQG
jgi:hypothetical protein